MSSKTKKKVGGNTDIYLELEIKTMPEMEAIVESIRKAGGRILHALPPRVLVASVPSKKITAIRKISGVAQIFDDIIPEAGMAQGAPVAEQVASARQAWNSHLSTERRISEMESAELGKSWDDKDRLPPHPPEEIMDYFHKQERELMPENLELAPAAQGAPNFNIPVLVGRVAVGVVFVDSTNAAYAITNDEKWKIVSETTEGLNMLSAFEPRAGIEWFYNYQRPRISLSAASFPAGNPNQWEDTWRNAALQSMGFPANFDGMNQYINQIKTTYNAQHAYAIFVTKYPKVWFAYAWGNHVVMDFGVDGWGIDNFSRVVAHETGHIFGCPDEYGSCSLGGLYGRYQVPNSNCENGNPGSIPCLMRANTPSVCDFTRAHLGWNELAVRSRGNTVLRGTWTFDFDSGIQGPAAGSDLWWEQVNSTIRFLVPQGGATFYHMGTPNFDAVSRNTLSALPYSMLPINGSNNASNRLTPNTVIAIRTGAGRFAKMRIVSYGYNLTIDWVTYQ